MSIEVVRFGKENQPFPEVDFSALYRSPTTRELDRLYGLDGRSLTDEETKRLEAPFTFLWNTESEIIMPRFTRMAGKLGYFVGVRLNEIPKWFYSDTRGAIQEGWLQTYWHEDEKI